MDVSSLTQQQSFVTNPIIQRVTVSPTEDNSSTQATASIVPSTDTLSIASGKSIIVQQVVTQQLEIFLEINSPSVVRHHDHDYHNDHRHNHEHQNDELANRVIHKIHNVVDTESFENPLNQIRKLFAKIADMFAFENSLITTGHKDFVKELFNDVVDGLENNAEADDDIDEQVLEVA